MNQRQITYSKLEQIICTLDELTGNQGHVRFRPHFGGLDFARQTETEREQN